MSVSDITSQFQRLSLNSSKKPLSEIYEDTKCAEIPKKILELVVAYFKDNNLPKEVIGMDKVDLIRTHLDIARCFHQIDDKAAEPLLTKMPFVLCKYL